MSPVSSVLHTEVTVSIGLKTGYKQNSRLKYMTLIQNIMENRLRHASGPVLYNHSVVKVKLYSFSASQRVV